MLAGRVGAVMATDAIAGDVDVIEVRRCPGDSRMAVVASIAADHVRRVFADGCDAIMAGTAITDDLCVIDGEDRCEHIGCVAVLADVACQTCVVPLPTASTPLWQSTQLPLMST